MKVMTQKMIFSMVFFDEINTPQFSLVIRSQNGNGCDFKHEICEKRGKKNFKPTKIYCFVKYVKFITGQDYKQQYVDFMRRKTMKYCD